MNVKGRIIALPPEISQGMPVYPGHLRIRKGTGSPLRAETILGE